MGMLNGDVILTASQIVAISRTTVKIALLRNDNDRSFIRFRFLSAGCAGMA